MEQHVARNLLKAEESCLFACNANAVAIAVLGNGSHDDRIIIAVVVNNANKSKAVFILSKKANSDAYLLKEALPIFEDMAFSYDSEQSTLVDIRYRDTGKVSYFDLITFANLKAFANVMDAAVSQAQKVKFNETCGSHQWMSTYKAGVSQSEGAESSISTETAQWLSNLLKSREPEFTSKRNFLVFVGTWNVNGQKPPVNSELDSWLLSSKGLKMPDIYFIGFQELDRSVEGLLAGGDVSRAQLWKNAILTSLKRAGDYAFVALKQLVGVILYIFMKKVYAKEVSCPQSCLVPVGIMGIMGNKGGVAIRLNLFDSTFCVVNSHLHAHHSNVNRRNSDFKEISSRMQFSGAYHTIFDHEYLFWMGDLNYRVDLPDNEIREKIAKQDWQHLMAGDQLKQQMAAGQAFESFQEQEVRFAPTYKYVNNSLEYVFEKERSPGYCDRVLWIAQDPKAISALSYLRHELLISDHRPVSALFQLPVKSIAYQSRERVLQDLLKQLDTMENERHPIATVSTNDLNFGKVAYMKQCARSVTLNNTGQVHAKWWFIPVNNDQTYCPRWLTIHPHSGLLEPGARIVIDVKLNVDSTCAAQMSSSTQTEHILILHVENGKDYFITITCEYMASCFGSSLEKLVLFPGPLRSSQPLPSSATEKLPIPKELWRVVDYIFRNGLQEPHIFNVSGEPSEIEKIRECLDTGKSFATFNFSPHSMAEVLLRFLESLSEPVIPFSSYRKCLQAVMSYSTCCQYVREGDPSHVNVFFYLVAFLKELLACGEQNHVKPQKLAWLFGTVMLRNPPESPEEMGDSDLCTKFLLQFLEDDSAVTHITSSHHGSRTPTTSATPVTSTSSSAMTPPPATPAPTPSTPYSTSYTAHATSTSTPEQQQTADPPNTPNTTPTHISSSPIPPSQQQLTSTTQLSTTPVLSATPQMPTPGTTPVSSSPPLTPPLSQSPLLVPTTPSIPFPDSEFDDS
ncbi:inositol 5-phosphatase 4 [Pelomyxa schiedti]|nr:inositol 5-phosphatase 4 [Pelomyxa schiedti]